MCGIFGVLGNISENKAITCIDRIAHRGPDGRGIRHKENITLAHRRLSILDLSEKGNMPMSYANQRYWLTYNGEIYNFLEIRKELISKGYTFSSESDSEVILASFCEWKEKCLQKFNGMWAFALWDELTSELFLARDRFGKKPLFYSYIDGNFVFASEMKAFFPLLKEIKPSVDFEWCKNNYILYESTDKSLIDGIIRFPAGHYAYIDNKNKKLNLTKYWETIDNLVNVPDNYNEQVECFRELFIDACKIRMRSDVPIGTALSGGLDSSAVATTMAHIGSNYTKDRITNDWQHAFVATFPNLALDESYYAKKIINHIGIKGNFIEIDPIKGLDKMDDYLYKFEELYNTSPVPMMDLYAGIKNNGIVVSVDGHGADELMAGYGADIFNAFKDCGLNIKNIKNIFETYKGLTDDEWKKVDPIKANYRDYFFTIANLSGGKREMIKFFLKELTGLNKKENISEKRFGEFNKCLYYLTHSSILPTLLRNYDRYAMSNGVEIRMPFMDYRIVTFLFSLSWKSKLRNGYTKAILRDAIGPFMPDEITYRTTKIGFNTPIADWMKKEWKEYFLTLVHSNDFANSTLIDSKSVRNKVVDVINNPSANFIDGLTIWTMLTPYLWEKAVIKRHL